MIDFDAPTPLFMQIADHLHQRVDSGELRRRLPAVRTVAQTYGVANATAARALRELVDRGIAVTSTGRGTFVVPPAERSRDDTT